jgi:hypothetical protein
MTPPVTPATQAKKPGKGCGIVIAAVIVLVLIVALTHHSSGSGGTSTAQAPASTQASASASSPTPTKPGTPGMHQVARDGDFAFVVEHKSCGAASAAAVDADGMGETVPAGARECIFTIKITDDKGDAQTWFAENQYAYDKAGHRLSADDNATFLSGENDDTQVNPGISIKVKLPFQIPESDRITRLELHDSAFSGGVTVRI